MVVASPLNLKRVTSSVNDSRKKVTEARSSVKNIGQVLLKRTKVKREAFTQTNLFRKRREESEKRQLLEDELRAPSIVMRTGGPQQLTQSAGVGGFFDRILGFIGYLSAGWIMNNIPTWIAMGKEFIARIQKAGQIISGFFNNTIKLFANVGNILGSLGQNLMQFDFFDTSNRVKTAMGDLNFTMGNLTSQIEEAFGLLTTPLTEGKYSGEKIPEVGTQQTNEGAYVEPPPFTGKETTAGGKVATPQAIYSYLRQLGVSHIHAVGILANIKGESGFRIDADETGRGTGGIGLFQYTYPSRKQAFLRSVPDYKTNWKGQIDFAIKSDPNTPLYLAKRFNSAEEAADDFMRNWENPAKRVYAGRRKKHNEFIKNFKSGSTSQQQSAQVTPPAKSITPIITSRYGESRGVRTHGGTDLAVKQGTSLRAVSDGTIVDSDFENGWGNFLVMKDNLGIYHLYGHMQSGYKRSGPVKKGEVIGKVGMSGRTNGPHLHWETGTGWNGGVITGKFDPLKKYSKFAPFNATQEAQISAPPQQSNMVSASITQERRGQDIMIVQPQQQQNIITPASGGGDIGPSPISDFQLLNNFIKNKLLLDLAYL